MIINSSLIVEECCTCGVPFGITSVLQAELLKSHKTFHCPSGHAQHYTGKSDAEKLADARAALAEESKRLGTLTVELIETKAKLKRCQKPAVPRKAKKK